VQDALGSFARSNAATCSRGRRSSSENIRRDLRVALRQDEDSNSSVT